jgi:hypothetical protein
MPRQPATFSIFGTSLQEEGILLHIAWLPPDAVRTKVIDFEPPYGWNWHLRVWVVACFSCSCRLVFDMTPITEFDPVWNGFSMESVNLGVDLYP